MPSWWKWNTRPPLFVGVAELGDALGLGPSGETRESSNLSSDTTLKVGDPERVVGSNPAEGISEKKSTIGGSPRSARRPNYTEFSSQNLIFGFVPARLAIKENFYQNYEILYLR